jgi:hypothetical protein
MEDFGLILTAQPDLSCTQPYKIDVLFSFADYCTSSIRPFDGAQIDTDKDTVSAWIDLPTLGDYTFGRRLPSCEELDA